MQIRPLDQRVSILAARLILCAALLIFYALAVDTALAKSPTNDEPVHLTRAALLAQAGNLALQFEHAPLSHRLIGLLLPTEATIPAIEEMASFAGGDRLDIADEFLWQSGIDVERTLFLGRLPIIWLALALGAVLALWTTAVAGQQTTALSFGRFTDAGLATLAVVLSLYAFSSNLIAAAAVATTDLAATATYFAAVCAWWFFWQRRHKLPWLLTGLLLGLALSAKLTGVLLIPLLLPLAYVTYRRDEPWWRPGVLWLSLLPVAAVALWAVYGFEIGRWSGLTLPAASYFTSWDAVLNHVSTGHQSYFLGQLSSEGWWLYFPVTFLIKTPLPLLLLLAGALVWAVQRRPAWGVAAFTLLPAAGLLVAAVYSRLNIGYRHILPVLPFLLVTIALMIPALWARPRWRWLLGGAMAWIMVATIWQHPHHLAYFNEAVGGPAQGYRYLGDSNLDWGQDLNALAELAADREGELFVSYAGSADPAYYDLSELLLVDENGVAQPGFSPANPGPGIYAISASHWQGILPDADTFDWFRHRSPDGTLGYSILLYQVNREYSGQWVAHCLTPGPILEPVAAEQLLGQSGLRHVYFDCQQSWVFPESTSPGWYILPRRDEAPWVADELASEALELVFKHRATVRLPDFSVYYWPGGDVGAALRSINRQTVVIEGEGQTTLPVSVDDTAVLAAYQPGQRDWLTLWRVEQSAQQPLSVQAHLYVDPTTSPVVADGLGFSSDQWQTGDWFVQRHVFPDGEEGAVLETGLYDYLTLEALSPRLRLPAAERQVAPGE